MASTVRQHRGIAPALMALVAALAVVGAGGTESQMTEGTTGHEGHHAAPAQGTAAQGAPSQAKGTKPARDGVYKTITGEVMDPACFLEAGPKSIGQGHYQCAIDCIRSGQTLAIYDRDADRIYFVAGELPGKNPNEPLLPYLHKKVDVTGTVYNRSQAWGIVIVKVAPHKAGAAAPAAAPKGGTR